MNYESLPINFYKKGFTHKLIQSTGFRKHGGVVGDWRIYERIGKGQKNPHYEVVLICNYDKERVFPNGTIQPPHEYYPSSEQWGRHGFTFTDLESAQEKLRKLTTKPNQQTIDKILKRFNIKH
jgi:hypothetical protein